MPPSPPLADRLDDALPQTQCRRCGYDGCRPYAEAIAGGDADQSLPARRRRADRDTGGADRRAAGRARPGARRARPLTRRPHRRDALHRLHAVHRRVPRRRDRRRGQAHAHGAARRCAPAASCASRPARSTASRMVPAGRAGRPTMRARRAARYDARARRSRRRALRAHAAPAAAPAMRRRPSPAERRRRRGSGPRAAPRSPRRWNAPARGARPRQCRALAADAPLAFLSVLARRCWRSPPPRRAAADPRSPQFSERSTRCGTSTSRPPRRQRFRAELATLPAGDPQRADRRHPDRAHAGPAPAVRRGRRRRSTRSSRGSNARPHAVRVRYLLERGRTFNSSGAIRSRAMTAVRRPRSRPAPTTARPAPTSTRVDALHMLGIAAPLADAPRLEPQGAGRWPRRRPTRARAAGTPSLYNNIGWAYFDRGRRGDRARVLAPRARAARGAPATRRPIASRSGRSRAGLRAIGALDEAQAMQRALAAETEAARRTRRLRVRGTRGIRARARRCRGGACRGRRRRTRCSSDDPGFVANEAPRLARLRKPRPARPQPHERRQAPRDLRAAARRQSASDAPSSRTRTPFELLVAVVLSAQATDKGVNKATAKLFPVASTPAAIAALGVDGTHPVHRSRSASSATRRRTSSRSSQHPAARARRRGAGRPRGAGSAAGRGPQDRQRRAQHRVRAADDRRRHAHLPRRQPHGPRARQERRRGRAQAREVRAGRIQAGRAPLADPARTLRLRRACAEMRRVHRSATSANTATRRP